MTYSECSSNTYYEHWQVFSYYTSATSSSLAARIHFEILILVFKAIHRLPPPYISDLISLMLKSSYNLRSNSSLLMEPPKEEMLSTLGARSFYAAAPYLWNSVRAELCNIQSLIK